MRRHNLELRVGTVFRLLVGSPSAKLRGVSKATALHVIVGDFNNQLRPQWFPGQVLALTPSTDRSGPDANGDLC